MVVFGVVFWYMSRISQLGLSDDWKALCCANERLGTCCVRQRVEGAGLCLN